MRSRRGAALAMVLLLVLILDCILIGTLHLAAQERQISVNSAHILQLRTSAESAVRRAIRSWSESVDSLPTGTRLTLHSPSASVEMENVGGFLFLIRAEAREPGFAAARATAQILAVPPAFPPASPSAPAPLSTGSRARVTATGDVRAAPPASCPAVTSAHTVLAATPLDVVVDPGGLLDAPSGILPHRPLHAEFPRITTLAATRVHFADTVIAAPVRGVLIVEGNVTLAAGTVFQGLLVVRGSLDIEAGAVVHGAVHVGGDVSVAGTIVFDPCSVRTELGVTGLDRARPVATRAWVPSF